MNDDGGPAEPETPAPLPSPGTGGQQDRDARALALAGYLRANRHGFTEDALRRAAAAAGYDEREIAAAWAVSAEPVGGRGSNSKAILVVIGYFVGVFVVASVLAAIPETSLLGLPAIGVGLLGAIF